MPVAAVLRVCEGAGVEVLVVAAVAGLGVVGCAGFLAIFMRYKRLGVHLRTGD